MAAAAVVNQQSAVDATTATTHTITPTGIVAGNVLLLMISNAGGLSTGSVTGVADTGGNVYTIPLNSGVSGVTNTRLAFAYCLNCVAPGTITVTSGSIANTKILLLQVSGLQNAPHDALASDFAAATALTNVAPSVTLTAGGMAFAAVARGGTANPTGITAGWNATTAGIPDLTAPIVRGGFQQWPNQQASGTCGFTFAASAQAGLGMIAFRRQDSLRQLCAGGVGK